jgi:hypothetical protein
MTHLVSGKNVFDLDAVNYVTNMSINDAEARFKDDPAQLVQIKLEFDQKSKDDVIGKRKLVEFFTLGQLHNTYLERALYQIIKNSGKLNLPIDYQKFISFMAILHHGTRLERLLLIFGIFGRGIPKGDEA